jgi:small subunit ribosomal protein S12e
VRSDLKKKKPHTQKRFAWLVTHHNGIAAGGAISVNTSLQSVLKTALIHDGLSYENQEAAKPLNNFQVHLCVLAHNCNEIMYVNLLEALYAEHQINLIKVDDNSKQGK